MSRTRRSFPSSSRQPYECLFRFFVEALPGYCWLRLYPLPADRYLVLLGAVPNFWYPSLISQSLPLVSQVAQRFYLEPTHTLWIEYHPPDQLGGAQRGAYTQLHLSWAVVEGRVEAVAYERPRSWLPEGRAAVEELVGVPVRAEPFWLSDHLPGEEEPFSYHRTVGGWQLTVWQKELGWTARVVGQSWEGQREMVRPCLVLEAAQQWAVEQAANLAQEFDRVPAWLGQGRGGEAG